MTGKQSLLSGVSLVGAVLAAFFPWVLSSLIVPTYASANAELPGLTLLWLRFWPVSLVLPVAVAVLWWRLETKAHPRRGAITAIFGAAGALLVDGFSVIVLWLPLLRLPDLAGG